ncbi:hypothetical protein PCANC_18666 [Puccinia coronata f. sp. avenae]|uniref:CWF21 domain-containing protein n=1 Tax=Puccinia coronata f. sp. avenae TaxID=200324 RepID=A0A2N5VC70_9BASI|nr:hypothetical protein PCANC_18666 [Puccinia coronata f. sp. avenae]
MVLRKIDLFFFLDIIDIGLLNGHTVVEPDLVDLFSKGSGGNLSRNNIADLTQLGFGIVFKGRLDLSQVTVGCLARSAGSFLCFDGTSVALLLQDRINSRLRKVRESCDRRYQRSTSRHSNNLGSLLCRQVLFALVASHPRASKPTKITFENVTKTYFRALYTLATPRGSGTSGYVQRNLSQPRPPDDYGAKANDRYDDHLGAQRKPDQSMLEHERKRRVENKCVELQLELEEQEIAEEEVTARVDELRQKLLKEELARGPGPVKPHQSHEIAAMKLKENEKFREALGVMNSSYVEGQAFDRELQAQRKAQAIEERQQRDAERAAQGLSSVPPPRTREKPYDKPL